jgi:hypothetical protein
MFAKFSRAIAVASVLAFAIAATGRVVSATALYPGDSFNCNGDVRYSDNSSYSLSCIYETSTLGYEVVWTGGVYSGWFSGGDTYDIGPGHYGSHSNQNGYVGSDGFAQMQSDGNFVLYTGGDVARWATNTSGYGSSAFLNLQNDGNLVVYYNTNVPIWSIE